MLVRTLLLSLLLSIPMQASAAGYVVQPGDTLGGIASRQGVSLGTLARANHIGNVNFIRAGTVLLIPAPTRRVSGHYFWYQVPAGDTLIGISSRYGLYISTIRTLNPQLGAYPLAGEWLRLCSPCSSYVVAVPRGTSAYATPVSPGAASFYVVKPGDSLITIAGRFGTTVSSLLTANRLLNPNLIVIGSHLTVPAQQASPSTSTLPSYDPWSARSLITSFAAEYGVDPGLALAVSWQESGFNQSVLSATGAVGVMQVEPYTATRIASLLGKPIDLYLLSDNVQAGVFWLATLLRYYGGNSQLAVAAYYQGTRSIAVHGLFTDTVQYVRDVLALQVQFGG